MLKIIEFILKLFGIGKKKPTPTPTPIIWQYDSFVVSYVFQPTDSPSENGRIKGHSYKRDVTITTKQYIGNTSKVGDIVFYKYVGSQIQNVDLA